MGRLTNNEVREVARMQRLIDTYEGFIETLFVRSRGKELTVLKFKGTPLDGEMSELWKFVGQNSKQTA